ncbi:MAG: hypothetical protein HY655_11665 [Acidobacteria bacterium]|nr:hypothetical protein [Acidobacteriota bacterium]
MVARRPFLRALCVTPTAALAAWVSGGAQTFASAQPRAARSPIRTLFTVSAEFAETTLPLVPGKNSRDNRTLDVRTKFTIVNAAPQR